MAASLDGMMNAADLPPGWSKAAIVSRQAVQDNIRALVAKAASDTLLHLSSDAWGHGLLESARAATDAGVRLLAVPTVRDAQLLRQEGVDGEFVVWGSDETFAEASEFARRVATVQDLAAALAAGARSIWLDLGIRPGDASLGDAEMDLAVDLLRSSPSVALVLCSEDAARADAWANRLRRAGVDVDTVLLPVAATSERHAFARQVMRLGAEAFGVSETKDPAPASTRPALSLRAPVIAIKPAPADVGVSYGYTYRTTTATTLALIPIGYGDGVDRSLGNRARVLLAGQAYTIAGRVAMDATVLDIGSAPVVVGQVAEFFGDPHRGAPSAQDYAALLGIPSAALVAGITARVGRIWR